MSNLLSGIAEMLPLLASGFSNRTDTVDQVLGIQGLSKENREREELKNFGREIMGMPQDQVTSETVFEVAKKYPSVTPMKAMDLITKFRDFRAERAQKYSRVDPDGRVIKAELTPSEIGDNTDKWQLGDMDGRPWNTELNQKKLTAEEEMKYKRDRLDAQKKYWEGRLDQGERRIAKMGSGEGSSKTGKLVSGVDINTGEPTYFRDTGTELVPVPGGKPKPDKPGSVKGAANFDTARKSIQDLELTDDAPKGTLLKFTKKVMDNQKAGMLDPVTPAYYEVLKGIEGDKKKNSFLNDIKSFLTDKPAEEE